MKFTILNANNQTDLLNEHILRIGKGLKQNRKQVVVVPDKFSLTMEKDIMQKLDLSASTDFSVYTFATLSELMLKKSNVKVLSSLGATYVVQMLLDKHKSELKCFLKTNKTINFASVIFDNISQLKSCNITPAMLKGASLKVENKLLEAKLLDIALIYEKYEEYLKNSFVDSANRLSLLSDRIRQTTSFSDVDVHVCNFSSLTAKNLDVIGSLIKSAKSVCMGIVVADKGQPNGYLFKSDVMESVLSMCKQLKTTPNFVSAKKTQTDVQNHIICNLLANKFETALPNSQVFPMVCGNVQTEARFCAMDIASKVKQGERFKDIVLNCTSLESYAPILRKCFNDYKIPYWIDLPFAFKDSELCKFLNTLFAVYINNFSKDDVLKVSKSVFGKLDINEQMLFERVVLRYGIDHDMFFQTFSTNDPDYKEFLKIVKKVLWPIKEFCNSIKKCSLVSEYIVSLQNFFELIQAKQTLEQLCQQNVLDGDLWNESINRQVFDRFLKGLETLYDIMAEYKTTFEDFCLILNAGLTTLTISPLPMALDCVYVGQNLQSVFEPAKHLYILGAHEGAYPAVVGDVGLISDLDILALSKNKVDISPTITQVNSRSVQNVVLNTAMFTQTLHISYPLQSSDGTHTPSSAFLSLKQIFSPKDGELAVENIDDLLKSNERFNNEENRLVYLWGNLNNALSWVIAESNDEESTVDKKYLSTAIKVLKENGFLDVFSILDDSILCFDKKPNIKSDLFKNKPHLSVTQLERYFGCPYQHFVDYGLKLSKNDTSDIASVDNGNIIHSVLEQFVLYYKKYPQLSQEQIEKVVKNIFDKILQNEEFERFFKNDKNKFALKKLKLECVRACVALVFQQKHSKYQIKFVEKSFGSKDFVDIPQIAVLNKKFKIKGKVDRLDEWNGKYRIVDYKTSKNASTFSLLDLYLGKKIQLFFYLNAVVEGLKQKGQQASPSGVYYLPIHREYSTDAEKATEFDGFRMEGLTLQEYENIVATDDTLNEDNLKSCIVDLTLLKGIGEHKVSSRSNKLATRSQLESALRYSKNIATKAIAEIEQGFVKPKPLEGVCDYCAYKHICKISCAKSVQARTKDFKIDIQTFEGIEE